MSKQHTNSRAICFNCKVPFCPDCWGKCPHCFGEHPTVDSSQEDKECPQCGRKMMAGINWWVCVECFIKIVK